MRMVCVIPHPRALLGMLCERLAEGANPLSYTPLIPYPGGALLWRF